MSPVVRASWSLFATLLATCAGCAPTAVSPMVIRLNPGDPNELTGRVSLQTGPRLSAPFANALGGGVAGTPGDANIFSVPQWGLAYTFSLTKAITTETSLHAGAQAEFFYPFPLPAYGAYTGVSHYLHFGQLSLAPSLVVRGATDFGSGSSGGPGTLLSGELSLTMGWHPEDRIALGLAPFVSYNRVWSRQLVTGGLYTGAVLVVHLRIGKDSYEVSGGFGRVFLPSGLAWTVPLIGVSAGR